MAGDERGIGLRDQSQGMGCAVPHPRTDRAVGMGGEWPLSGLLSAERRPHSGRQCDRLPFRKPRWKADGPMCEVPRDVDCLSRRYKKCLSNRSLPFKVPRSLRRHVHVHLHTKCSDGGGDHFRSQWTPSPSHYCTRTVLECHGHSILSWAHCLGDRRRYHQGVDLRDSRLGPREI